MRKTRPARSLWNEGLGPSPHPKFLVRHLDASGQCAVAPCQSEHEALNWATDARDDSGSEAAIYMLWHVEPAEPGAVVPHSKEFRHGIAFAIS